MEAWRQLHTLRDSEKLRPWLCGILRFKASRWRRSDGREPVRQAEPLEQAADVPSLEEPPRTSPWTARSRPFSGEPSNGCRNCIGNPSFSLPRASLRRTCSRRAGPDGGGGETAAVARTAILQERMLSFVEGALHRSTPGRVFTVGVLAALPGLAPKAEAAALGTAAATHGGFLAKSMGLAPLLTAISGFVSAVLTLGQSRPGANPAGTGAVVQITATLFLGALVSWSSSISFAPPRSSGRNVGLSSP